MASNSIEAAVAKALPCECHSLDTWDGDHEDTCGSHWHAAVLALVSEAVAAERAKCCADICHGCADEPPQKDARTGTWRHGISGRCQAERILIRAEIASSIRKRGEAQG